MTQRFLRHSQVQRTTSERQRARRIVNQRFLTAMLEMGIPLEKAELALSETGNVGVEVRGVSYIPQKAAVPDAVVFMLAHQMRLLPGSCCSQNPLKSFLKAWQHVDTMSSGTSVLKWEIACCCRWPQSGFSVCQTTSCTSIWRRTQTRPLQRSQPQRTIACLPLEGSPYRWQPAFAMTLRYPFLDTHLIC